jgi:4-hydroxy-tetrahydrodipicolinate synthase
MIDLTVAGDLATAAQEHRRLLPLFKGLFVISSPIPIKYCLNKAGFNVGSMRLPLVNADPKTAAFLDDLMSGYKVDLSTTVAA